MPGLVLFRRRWAIGSDDFVLPAFTFGTLHAVWLLGVLCTVLPSLVSESPLDTTVWIHRSLIGLNVTCGLIQFLNSIIDFIIAKLSSTGGILDEADRRWLPILLYIRFGLLSLDLLSTLAGTVWLSQYYSDPNAHGPMKKCLLASVIWQILSSLAVWSLMKGSYDSVGKQWLLLKRFEDRSQRNPRIYKRSSARRRTWRRRKVLLAYQASWRRRLRFLAGCIGATEDDKAALTEAANLFTEFFYDLDVVPSDLLAGFVLLRRQQKRREKTVLEEIGPNTKTRRILSGAVITPSTKFMDFHKLEDVEEIRTLRYYMQYALAAYGWPFYLTNNKYGRLCQLLLHVRILPRPSSLHSLALYRTVIMEDNCFHCNSTAVKLTLPRAYVTLIYACWHCHIGQTPFYVAVDHRERAVVVCVRGTLSMNDFITDFNAQPENIPLIDPRPSSEYQAHRGIIAAAMYVFQRLKAECIMEAAFSNAGPGYKLVIVGHSLGGGAATILAMLLRPMYPDLHCYVFAPPGGLLTQPAVELCRNYVTTLIVGKDIVARLALSPLESMRSEMVRLLTICTEPKWRILGKTISCCQRPDPEVNANDDVDKETLLKRRYHIALRNSSRSVPSVYPPGNVVHIVRSWSEKRSRLEKPRFVAIRADNSSFNEILVSPVMIHDHMPEGIIEALDGLLEQIQRVPRQFGPTAEPVENASRNSSMNFRDHDQEIEEIV